jgi:hypothetical protein
VLQEAAGLMVVGPLLPTTSPSRAVWRPWADSSHAEGFRSWAALQVGVRTEELRWVLCDDISVDCK